MLGRRGDVSPPFGVLKDHHMEKWASDHTGELEGTASALREMEWLRPLWGRCLPREAAMQSFLIIKT